MGALVGVPWLAVHISILMIAIMIKGIHQEVICRFVRYFAEKKNPHRALLIKLYYRQMLFSKLKLVEQWCKQECSFRITFALGIRRKKLPFPTCPCLLANLGNGFQAMIYADPESKKWLIDFYKKGF